MVKKKKRIIKLGNDVSAVSLISPTATSALRITFSTVNWSASVWFERNFAFLSAFSTDCFVHFSSSHFLFQLLYYFSAKTFFLHEVLTTCSVLKLMHISGLIEAYFNLPFASQSCRALVCRYRKTLRSFLSTV
jgi:hypothetical protein